MLTDTDQKPQKSLSLKGDITHHHIAWKSTSVILDFWNSQFLTVRSVKTRTKFRKDLSKSCRDITIFVIFKMAAAAILDLQKFEILTVGPL